MRADKKQTKFNDNNELSGSRTNENDARTERELRNENEALYRRIDELEAQITKLRSEADLKTGDDEISRCLHKRVKNEYLMSARYYPRYLLNLLKSTSFFAVYQRALMFFRRFRLISGTLKIAAVVVAWAETSAVFLVSLSVLIVVVPVTTVLALASLSMALVRSHNANEAFGRIISGKKVYILFGDKKQMKNSDYFSSMVRNFSDSGNVCIVISPYFFAKQGLGGKGHYVTGRHEYANVYLVRKNYFFVLRRILLEKNCSASELIYIY